MEYLIYEIMVKFDIPQNTFLYAYWMEGMKITVADHGFLVIVTNGVW